MKKKRTSFINPTSLNLMRILLLKFVSQVCLIVCVFIKTFYIYFKEHFRIIIPRWDENIF